MFVVAGGSPEAPMACNEMENIVDDGGGDVIFLAILITEMILDLVECNGNAGDEMRKECNDWDNYTEASGKEFLGLA